MEIVLPRPNSRITNATYACQENGKTSKFQSGYNYAVYFKGNKVKDCISVSDVAEETKISIYKLRNDFLKETISFREGYKIIKESL